MKKKFRIRSCFIAAMLSLFTINSAIISTTNVIYAAEEFELSYGDVGDEVKGIQSKINNIMVYNLTVDGIYGKDTKAAVSDFQKIYGFTKTDGEIVDQQVYNKLTDLYNLGISKTYMGNLVITKKTENRIYGQIYFSGKGIDYLSAKLNGSGNVKVVKTDWKPAYDTCTVYLEYPVDTTGIFTLELNNNSYRSFAWKDFNLKASAAINLQAAADYALEHAYDTPEIAGGERLRKFRLQGIESCQCSSVRNILLSAARNLKISWLVS